MYNGNSVVLNKSSKTIGRGGEQSYRRCFDSLATLGAYFSVHRMATRISAVLGTTLEMKIDRNYRAKLLDTVHSLVHAVMGWSGLLLLPVMESRDVCLLSRLCRDMVFHVSVFAQSRHVCLVLSLSRVSMSRHVSWYILFVCAYMYVRAAISAAFSLASLFVSHVIIITVLDELNKYINT